MSEPSPITLRRAHHVAIICAHIDRSVDFYVGVLGLREVRRTYRAARDSWKVDVELPDGMQLELFSFPGAPPRPSYPEAQGLRHLALEVDQLDTAIAHLTNAGVPCEPVRVDEFTGRRFTFLADPDGLPLELYETSTRT